MYSNRFHFSFGYLLRTSIPAVTTLAWLFIIAFFVRELVLEREAMLEQVGANTLYFGPNC